MSKRTGGYTANGDDDDDAIDATPDHVLTTYGIFCWVSVYLGWQNGRLG